MRNIKNTNVINLIKSFNKILIFGDRIIFVYYNCINFLRLDENYVFVNAVNNAKIKMMSKAARITASYILVKTYRIIMFLMVVTVFIFLSAVICFIRRFLVRAEVSNIYFSH